MTLSTILAVGLSLSAQDGAYSLYSPYSVFGVGDLYSGAPARNRGMGGVGIASRNKRYINYLNPASITARDTLSFMLDFGLSSENKVFRQNDIKSANNTLNINDIMVSVPLFPKTALMVGLSPFSSVGYDFGHYVTDPSIVGNIGSVEYTSSGNGSIYELLAAFAFQLGKEVSVGIQGMYYFGNIDKSSSMNFSSSTQRDISSGYIIQMSSFGAKAGAQWEHRITSDLSLAMGATYKLGPTMGGYVADYQYATLSSVTDTLRYKIDTLHKSRVLRMGSELGVGLAIKGGDRWIAEFDYIRSDWSGSNMDKVAGFANVGTNVFTPCVANEFRAGFEITPNPNDLRNMLRRWTYRGGAYYKQAYYQLNGANVSAIGLTAGVTIPITFRGLLNGITLGVDIGQKGSMGTVQTVERYAFFNIGFNIHDIWFVKTLYD